MRRFLLAMGGLLLLCSLADARLPEKSQTYRISTIRARLFYQHSGTLSEDVLHTPGGFALWNVVIGEGDAKEASQSTLVQVELTGTPGSYSENLRVEVVAVRRAKGHTVSDVRRVYSPGVFGKNGKWIAPLWLYDTGNEPIDIRARLLAPKRSAWVTARIPFASGE